MAAGVARQLVVYHRRPGGSRGTAAAGVEPVVGSHARALSFARERTCRRRWRIWPTLPRLSERQFGRLFARRNRATPAR